jgi:solute carrier family 25 carnitine/acylcarnitine transporter 20/29
MSPVELVKVKQQVIGVDLIKTTGEVSRGLLSHVGWKGLGATLWRDGIPHGVWFASYQWCKDILESKIGGTPRHDSVTIPLTAGAFAATTAWVRSTILLVARVVTTLMTYSSCLPFSLYNLGCRVSV